MATWNITADGVTGITGDGEFGSNSITPPAEFNNATINSVTVSGTPSLVTNSGPTNDTIGVRWRIQTTGNAAIYGDYGSDSASLCSAVLGDGVSSDTIADGASTSPAPTIGVSADWDEIAWQINYVAAQMPDGETVDWSTSGGNSFTIVVDYTALVAGDSHELLHERGTAGGVMRGAARGV